MAPQVQHVPVETSVVTLVPQCPQKGSDASTGLAHLGHVFVPGNGDTRVGGVSAPEPTAAPGMGVSGWAGAPITAADDEPAE